VQVFNHLVQAQVLLGGLTPATAEAIMTKVKELVSLRVTSHNLSMDLLADTEEKETLINMSRLASVDRVMPSLKRNHANGEASVRAMRVDGVENRPWQDILAEGQRSIEEPDLTFLESLAKQRESTDIDLRFGVTAHSLLPVYPTLEAVVSGIRVWSEGKDENLAAFMKNVLTVIHQGGPFQAENIPLPLNTTELSLAGCLLGMHHFRMMAVLGAGAYGFVVKCCFNLGILGHSRTDFIAAIKLEYLSVAEFYYFVHSLVDIGKVQCDGITKMLAYFPIEVKSFQVANGPPTKKVLMALVQEYGEMTLYDRLVEIHEYIKDLKTSLTPADEQMFHKNMQVVLREIYDIMSQLVDTSAALASVQVIHRDLKPGNIVQSCGKWKFIDFGFVRALPSSLDELTQRAGTPGYEPPFKDGNHDSYSLGCVSYELMVGPSKRPVTADGREESWIFKSFADTFRFSNGNIDPHNEAIVKDFSKVVSLMVSVRSKEKSCSVEPRVAKELFDGLRHHFE
jgi:Protein kinase domain